MLHDITRLPGTKPDALIMPQFMRQASTEEVLTLEHANHRKHHPHVEVHSAGSTAQGWAVEAIAEGSPQKSSLPISAQYIYLRTTPPLACMNHAARNVTGCVGVFGNAALVDYYFLVILHCAAY